MSPADGQACEYEHVEIPLTKGYVVRIDVPDALAISEWSWCAAERSSTVYAHGHRKGQLVYMHRLLLRVTDSTILVDHHDRDGLNNCRANLRLTGRGGNQYNSVPRGGTSRYKGVYRRPSGRWSVQITKDRKVTTVGSFATEDEAALAYNAAARRLHGAFARLNEVVQ